VVEVEVVEEVVEWYHIVLSLVNREVGEGFCVFDSLLQYRQRFLLWSSRGLLAYAEWWE